MIGLTIDGRRIEVDSGTTVLEAARLLGISVPTLCFVKGLEAAASCFLCAVQVEGYPRLSPSCALPVSEGMVVHTDSSDIRAARKMALELLLSDHAGDCIAPCQARCPAGLNISGFVHELASGDLRRSMEVISEKLALPGSLGRICPRLCEQGCRRCELDEGLAIGALHRYPADKEQLSARPFLPRCQPSSGKSVAIVGAGPAGLAAAYYLLQDGHKCVIHDAQDHPGGMLFYGIPSYRLPKDALAAEIDTIRSMGAEFRMRSVWGRDFTLKELLDLHDAVFIAIGASGSKNLRCEGDHWAESGIDFLEQVAKGQAPSLGDRVVVVGGGNTAMDAARSAIRLGTESVKVVYRRTKLEMPCLMEEVEAAEAEGVEIDYLVAPIHLERLDDLTLRLKCQKMKLGEADDSGRRRPIPQPGTEFSLNCTAVISAIGQSVDLELARAQGLETNDWGIAVNPVTGETSMEGVFAGGDAVLGADLAVRAVAAGRIGAVSIHQLLTDQPITGPQEMMSIQMTVVDEAERATFFREIERNPRPSPELIEMKLRRTSFDEVERGLSAAEVSAESRRCLSCGCGKAAGCVMRKYATEYGADSYRYSGERRRFSQDSSHPDVVYEPGKCIMCDACVRIAAEAGEEVGLAAIGRGFQVAMGVPFGEPLSRGLRRAAHRAVEACPTGALALRSGRSCDLAACDLCSLS